MADRADQRAFRCIVCAADVPDEETRFPIKLGVVYCREHRNPFGFQAVNLDDVEASVHAYETAAEDLETLAAYMRVKGQARDKRLRGQLESALRLERRCEALYEKLPEYLQW